MRDKLAEYIFRKHWWPWKDRIPQNTTFKDIDSDPEYITLAEVVNKEVDEIINIIKEEK